MYSSCESAIAYVRYSSDFVEFEKYALGKENFKFVDDTNIPKNDRVNIIIFPWKEIDQYIVQFFLNTVRVLIGIIIIKQNLVKGHFSFC